MINTDIIYFLVALLLTSPIVYGMYTFIKGYEKENTYKVRCETCERISYESCVQYSENYNKGYKDGRIDRSNGVKVKWWPGSVYPFIKEYQEEPRPMAIHTPTFGNYLELLSKEAYIEGYVEGYNHGPKYN